MTPVTIPTFFYRGTRTDTQEKGNKHEYLGWKSDKTYVKSLLANWEMLDCQKSYLFEPSVLDVELLGINEVKQFAVLFSEGKEKDRVDRVRAV